MYQSNYKVPILHMNTIFQVLLYIIAIIILLSLVFGILMIIILTIRLLINENKLLKIKINEKMANKESES